MSFYLRLACTLAMLSATNKLATADDTEVLPRHREVVAQRVLAETRATIREAARVRMQSPQKAARLLRDAMHALDGENALDTERIAGLRRELEQSLREIERAEQTRGSARRAAFRDGEYFTRPAARNANQPPPFSLRATAKLNSSRAAPSAGDPAFAAAARRSAEVHKQVQQMRGVSVAKNERPVSGVEQERRFSRPDLDVVASPDGKERYARRSVGPRPTAKEKAIIDALENSIDARLGDTTFSAVLDYLQTAMRQSFIVDAQALQDADVRPELPIRLNMRGVSGRTVLRKLLNENGLTFIVRDETIHILSPAQASTILTTRVYDCHNLIPPFATFEERYLYLAILKNLIETMVSTSSWQHAGGSGAVAINPDAWGITVRQAAEFHYKNDNRVR